MTDNTAKTVIKQCLDQFGSGPNEVLYENVILHYMKLATDEVGCRSLNECISTISGKQKIKLFEKIVDEAVSLSNDRYGNYVVQHAMILGHDIMTFKVMQRLCGHFTQLSQDKGGSHVVEKCLNSSSFGTDLVVGEILQTKLAPFQLARHQYGNYVIQAALRNLKRQRKKTLYAILVKALKPHFPQLQRNAGGKKVVNLIMTDIEFPYKCWPEYYSQCKLW
ncbi:uncharacterized protein [Primulina eburnea]|uniref:uncharacterized protein n=1 Tax=Primulina eburnea TaxID=1245227 RepID=UPI003C6C9E83